MIAGAMSRQGLPDLITKPDMHRRHLPPILTDSDGPTIRTRVEGKRGRRYPDLSTAWGSGWPPIKGSLVIRCWKAFPKVRLTLPGREGEGCGRRNIAKTKES